MRVCKFMEQDMDYFMFALCWYSTCKCVCPIVPLC